MNILDARGLSCPEPVIMIKKAVDDAKASNRTKPGVLPDGAEFTITVDNRTSVENITRFGEHSGLEVSSAEKDGDYLITLKKA